MITNEERPKLYKRRWAFILGISILLIFGGISFSSFGQINFYVQFFDSSHAQVDWITTGRSVSPMFISLPFALLIFEGKIKLRNLIIAMGACATTGVMLVTLSLFDSSLFFLIVLGQMISGLAQNIGLAVPSGLAALWFPESQVGTAIAFTVVGMFLGEGIGYIIPALLVPSSNRTDAVLSVNELVSGQHSLRYMYGSYFAVSAVVTILFVIFLTDKPATPPTTAQELKNTDLRVDKTSNKFCKVIKQLFTNPSYILVCILFGFNFQIGMPENLMMSEIVTDLKLSQTLSPDTLGGYVMSMFSLGGLPGLVIGGKVVDRCKRYKLLTCIGNAGIFVTTIAIATSVIFKSVAWLFASNAMFGFLTGFVCVSLFEMITQITYPIDETLVTTLMIGIQAAISLLISGLGRHVFSTWGSLGLLSFQCACALLNTVISCFVSLKNRRLEIVNGEDVNNCVHAALLTP